MEVDNASLIEPRHGHRIVCAAIRLKSGRVICGVRHFCGVMLQSCPPNTPEGRAQLAGHEQGFVDNKFQFLTREEAYKVALAAFQFDPESPDYTGHRGTLYSEDLW